MDAPQAPEPPPRPLRLDLERDRRLVITWADHATTSVTVAVLRRLCPCAVCKIARGEGDPHRLMRPATPAEQQASPSHAKGMKLKVVPASLASEASVTVTKAEPVGNYALRLAFSDGHGSGIYTWPYLREISSTADAADVTGPPSPG